MNGNHVRSIRLAVVISLGVTLLVAPIASADHTWVNAAGEGCSFDVLVEGTHLPEAAGGARSPIAWGDVTLTNLDTGATHFWRTRYSSSETFDPHTNAWLVEFQGRRFINFFPGDQGPNGLVEEPGLFLGFSGSFQYTVDADGFLFTSFSYQGQAIDLCAKLAT